MRPRAELDFIRDRVVAYVRANPSTEPLLTEIYGEPKAPPKMVCKWGHTKTEPGHCRECHATRNRRLRKAASAAVDETRRRVWGEGEGY